MLLGRTHGENDPEIRLHCGLDLWPRELGQMSSAEIACRVQRRCIYRHCIRLLSQFGSRKTPAKNHAESWLSARVGSMMGDVKPCVLAIQPDATPTPPGRALPGGRRRRVR